MLEGTCVALSLTMMPAAGTRAVFGAPAALPHPQLGLQRRAAWQQQTGSAAAASRSRRLPTGTSSIAAVSMPERLTVSDCTPALPPQEVEVRVIGVGSRGINAITKLVKHGKVGARCMLTFQKSSCHTALCHGCMHGHEPNPLHFTDKICRTDSVWQG